MLAKQIYFTVVLRCTKVKQTLDNLFKLWKKINPKAEIV